MSTYVATTLSNGIPYILPFQFGEIYQNLYIKNLSTNTVYNDSNYTYDNFNNSVVFNGIVDGDSYLLARITDVSSVNYEITDGALNKDALNKNFAQILSAIEEVESGFKKNPILGDLDMLNYSITNVRDGVNPQDAVTKNQINVLESQMVDLEQTLQEIIDNPGSGVPDPITLENSWNIYELNTSVKNYAMTTDYYLANASGYYQLTGVGGPDRNYSHGGIPFMARTDLSTGSSYSKIGFGFLYSNIFVAGGGLLGNNKSPYYQLLIDNGVTSGTTVPSHSVELSIFIPQHFSITNGNGLITAPAIQSLIEVYLENGNPLPYTLDRVKLNKYFYDGGDEKSYGDYISDIYLSSENTDGGYKFEVFDYYAGDVNVKSTALYKNSRDSYMESIDPISKITNASNIYRFNTPGYIVTYFITIHPYLKNNSYYERINIYPLATYNDISRGLPQTNNDYGLYTKVSPGSVTKTTTSYTLLNNDNTYENFLLNNYKRAVPSGLGLGLSTYDGVNSIRIINPNKILKMDDNIGTIIKNAAFNVGNNVVNFANMLSMNNAMIAHIFTHGSSGYMECSWNGGTWSSSIDVSYYNNTIALDTGLANPTTGTQYHLRLKYYGPMYLA